MALGATARHDAFSIPVTERLFGTGEVPGVDAVRSRHVHRLRQRRVQVGNRIMQELNDVLAAMRTGLGP